MSFLPIYYCTKTICVIAKSRLWGVSAIYQLCSSLYSSFEIFLNFPFSFWKCISHLRKYFFFICHWVIDTLTAGLKTRVAQSIHLLIRLHSTSRILSPFFPHFLPRFFPAFFRQYLRQAVCSGPLCSKLFVQVRGKAFTRNSHKKHPKFFPTKSL